VSVAEGLYGGAEPVGRVVSSIVTLQEAPALHRSTTSSTTMGAAVLAAERGSDPADLGHRRDKALALAHSQRLAHTVGVNGFFTALAAAARRSQGRVQLIEWWSERRCAATWGHIVRPDGYGRWREGSDEIDFFLEYDRGTEPLARLTDRIHAYGDLAAATGLTTPTLLWLPSPRREAEVRRAIAGAPVPVAITFGQDPSGEVWLPLSSQERRMSLPHLWRMT
jgi:hypothetical protein